MISLLPHQQKVLNDTMQLNRVAYFLDMGLGKTYVGAEKMYQLDNSLNLLICQKSKIKDWSDHISKNYPDYQVFNLTNKKDFDQFIACASLTIYCVGIINYELAWHRKELLQLKDFTLMLDESSLIQNEQAKQTKFILNLTPKNVILLSGTPVSGKYERLWSQCRLLGWNISHHAYDSMYVNYVLADFGVGYPVRIVDKHNPYKNVEHLKHNLRTHGAVFMKTEEVLTLPEQIFTTLTVPAPKEYRKFLKAGITTIDDVELIGSTALTKRLYARQICSQYNNRKLDALKDLINSSNDRFIVFYNFNDELDKLKAVAKDRPLSVVNGQIKDLSAYENEENSVTLVQYQAGALGLNLQKCNKMIFFSLPERSDLFEQAKKRIHRIGTTNTCFYWILSAENSIDGAIYKALEQKKDFTDALFKEICK